MWMRGGTSKGGYFLENDLPEDSVQRDAFLLQMMGSPDHRQIDGMGGADPLTSKVAIVKASKRKNVDVDYLFLQVFVDRAVVTDVQNCGNILAGVGPFALERGLVSIQDGETQVRIYMENTGQFALAKVQTPKGIITYSGEAKIDGVPGQSSPIALTFEDTAGSSCGALLPSGNELDTIDGVSVTCIDNGMPTVVLRAQDIGLKGNETPEKLESNSKLRAKLESIRLQAGVLMNLGDVTDKSVPKICMLSKALQGGCIATRTFIPHRCHASIGVLCAVSVATACMLKNSPAYSLSVIPEGKKKQLQIEHPSGETTVILNLNNDDEITTVSLLRTARKLFDGVVFAKTN
jgi:4-oxalomesaconate tautomerase